MCSTSKICTLNGHRYRYRRTHNSTKKRTLRRAKRQTHIESRTNKDEKQAIVV